MACVYNGAMTDADFRQLLTTLGFNQASFVRRLIELGDPRPAVTLRRNVQNYWQGNTNVPGEMVIILRLMAALPAVRGTPTTRGRGRPRKQPQSA